METQIYSVLTEIQSVLKAPKNQMNKFGGYKYRSCEDIIEAVKPLLRQYKANLVLDDELICIGNRFYVKATAIFTYGNERLEVRGYAREEEVKKLMDGSQITGTASSYARKYALNGLFLIDDNKDSDSTNKGNSKSETKEKPQELLTLTQQNIEYAIKEQKQTQVLKAIGVKYKATDEQIEILKNSINQ